MTRPTPISPDADPDERAFAEEFGAPLESLRTAMAACPPVDVLVAVDAGVLAGSAHEGVSAHVATCPLCQAALRDLRDAGVEAPTADELARVRNRVAGAPSPRSGYAVSPLRFWALAASLIAAVALGTWGTWLQRENNSLRTALDEARVRTPPGTAAGASAPDSGGDARAQELQAQRDRIAALEAQVERLAAQGPTLRAALNVPLIDLEPVDALRGGATRTADVPASASLVAIVLTTSGRGGTRYALEIRNADGRVTWEGQGLERSPDGMITLAVPRGMVPSGEARFRLFALEGGERILIDEYAVRVVDR